MARRSLLRTATVTAVVVVGVQAGSGCASGEGTPIVTGVMDRDASVELTRDHVIMRAIPDHPDGFAVGRDYRGPLYFEAGCPTEHLEFPFPYMLPGDQDDVDETDGVRWRLLVWETDDPNATWVKPGEAYGTVPFHFVDDPYGSWASGVDVVIDSVAQ
jgi:hypothetical protein